MLKRRARYELNLESLAFISNRNTAFQNTIKQLINHYQLAPASQTASAWANFFTEILDVLKWPGTGSLSSEEFQTQEAWRKVLQSFAQLDITQDAFSIGTAVSTLRRLCDQTLFQPEANPNAPIEIMGVLEAGGLQFDYLWLAGFNESAWPVPTNLNAFIPAHLQREAGIPLADIDRQYAINQQRFARLVEAAPQVVMSYARHTDGVTTLSSSAIAAMPASLVAAETKLLSSLIREQRPSLEWLADESGLPIADSAVTGGTQAMADQAACPFRAYARHRLSARIESDPEPGIDSMERGSLIHKILANLWTQLKTQQALQAAHDQDELSDLIQSVVNPLVTEASKQSGLGNTFCHSQQQRICALIEEWLMLELHRPAPFEVKAVEQRIEAFEIGGISLNIALDRLDQLGSDSDPRCFGVIDYKTGSGLDINQWSDERIEQPQLPLYALHVDEKIGPLGAVLYGQIRPNEAAFIGVSVDQDMLPGVNTVEANSRKKFGADFREWANLIPLWRERLGATAEALARGDAAVDPKTLNSCQYCDLGSFCRIEQHTGRAWSRDRTHMSQPSDQRQRDLAIKPDQSFIVQAPAGSGKTSLLVHRLLNLLTTVNQPEEILAITFTRKATAEMRERVVAALLRAQQGAAFESHEVKLGQQAERVLVHDQQLGWNLIANSQRLKIQTIDSLCAELVRQMPWSARFGAMPTIEERANSLFDQAALNTLQHIRKPANPAHDAVAALLRYFNGDIQKLRSLLADLLVSRGRWQPPLFNPAAPLTDRDQIDAAWQNYIKQTLNQVSALLPRDLRRQLAQLAAYAAANLPDASRPHPLEACSELDEFPLTDASQLPQWLGIVSLLCTNDEKLRSPRGINARLGFPLKTAEKQQLVEIVQSLDGDQALLRNLLALRHLPQASLNDTQWEVLDKITTLLKSAAVELHLLMRETNRCDFQELTFRAIDALGGIDSPSELALIRDYRLSHILMDEFQDTSPQQLDLIELLTAGWEPDDGRTLFLVGDPMQSIYRFREADVRVFLGAQRDGIGDIALQSLRLSVNFRSSNEIINWVNQHFPQVLAERDDPDNSAVSYAPAATHNNEITGQVEYCGLIDTDASGEAAAIVKRIQQELADSPDQEVAVLARSRTHLTPIATQLRLARIEFESIDLESLSDQAVVRDLFALCRALLHPMDRIAWLSVLRAPWCGLSLADLTLLSPKHEAIEHAWNDAAQVTQMSAAGQQQLSRLRTALRSHLAQRGRKPLTELVRAAWLSLDGPACINALAEPHVSTFFDLLHATDAQNPNIDLKKLQVAIDEHRISTPEKPVKLLTMHKAKGLEFDTVILAGLAQPPARASGDQPLLQLIDQGEQWLISPKTLPGTDQDAHTQVIKQCNAEREGYESGRIFYVAATRAKRKLLLFARLKTKQSGEISAPPKGSFLRFLWDELEDQFCASIKPAPDNIPAPEMTERGQLAWLPLDLPPLQLPPNLDIAPIDRASTEPIYEWAQERTRVIGIAVHRLLEHASLQDLDAWQHSIDQRLIHQLLIAEGVATGLVDECNTDICQILQSLHADPTARWLFDPTHQQLKTEWALTGVDQGLIRHLIIDRSFVDGDGTRWIIDFKTSAHQGGGLATFLSQQQERYRPQLERYARLVQALEPDKPIRLGLYFPALGEWLDWQI